MGILIIILFLAASSWLLIALIRRLRLLRVGNRVWTVFSFLATCGIALGVWCACYCEYQIGTRYRIGSFPIPIVFFHLEDGMWVDFPVPALQAGAAMLTNIVCITTLAMFPVWLLTRPRHNHEIKTR